MLQFNEKIIIGISFSTKSLIKLKNKGKVLVFCRFCSNFASQMRVGICNARDGKKGK